MAQTITTLNTKINRIEEEIKELENKRKRILEERKTYERKERTKRLCQRMGLIESLLPETITLSDDSFKSFVEKTILSEYAKKILSSITT